MITYIADNYIYKIEFNRKISNKEINKSSHIVHLHLFQCSCFITPIYTKIKTSHKSPKFRVKIYCINVTAPQRIKGMVYNLCFSIRLKDEH